MAHYLSGETLIEAYWKSVRMPGQGVFVGEPLARPFGGKRVAVSANATAISTHAVLPGNYLLEAATAQIGPYRPIRAVRVDGFGVRQLTLPRGDRRFFRLRSLPEMRREAPGASEPEAGHEPESEPEPRGASSP